MAKTHDIGTPGHRDDPGPSGVLGESGVPWEDAAVRTVPVRLHKDKHNTGDLFVSVNGQRFQIQRGVTVDVPYYVAEVLEHSQQQDNAALERRLKMAQQFADKKA